MTLSAATNAYLAITLMQLEHAYVSNVKLLYQHTKSLQARILGQISKQYQLGEGKQRIVMFVCWFFSACGAGCLECAMNENGLAVCSQCISIGYTMNEEADDKACVRKCSCLK